MTLIQKLWLWIGIHLVKWKYIDMKTNKDEVEAMTFSNSLKYIKKVGKL